MNKYKITLEVKDTLNQYPTPEKLEIYFLDVAQAALDALGLELTFSQATKKRG